MKDEVAMMVLAEASGVCLNDELYQAYAKAISALDKRIPKKPIKCNPLNDDDEMLDENEYYKCPLCGFKFRKIYFYCHRCGQALDWED